MVKLWYVGQFVSTIIGISIGLYHGFPAGILTAYALFILVDIRFELTAIRDKLSNKSVDL